MKLLFFSYDVSEVQLASKALLEAGVPCRIRKGREAKRRSRDSYETELWIRHAKDTNQALTLCVRLGVGFGKRPVSGPVAEDQGVFRR